MIDRESLNSAVTLSSAAILAALVQTLVKNGALSPDEVKEVYETALMLLEAQQGTADGEFGAVIEMARELIEEHLRPPAR